MSGVVWIDRENKSATQNCAQRNYFRFAAAILLTVIAWTNLRPSESIQETRRTHGNRAEKQLPVCCRYGWLYLESTAVALHSWNTRDVITLAKYEIIHNCDWWMVEVYHFCTWPLVINTAKSCVWHIVCDAIPIVGSRLSHASVFHNIADQQHHQVWLGSYQWGRPHVVEKYELGVFYYFFILSFLATRTAQVRQPISPHDSSNDAVWRKKVPPSKCFSKFWILRVIFPENATNFAGSREIPAEMKKSNNS